MTGEPSAFHRAIELNAQYEAMFGEWRRQNRSTIASIGRLAAQAPQLATSAQQREVLARIARVNADLAKSIAQTSSVRHSIKAATDLVSQYARALAAASATSRSLSATDILSMGPAPQASASISSIQSFVSRLAPDMRLRAEEVLAESLEAAFAASPEHDATAEVETVRAKASAADTIAAGAGGAFIYTAALNALNDHLANAYPGQHELHAAVVALLAILAFVLWAPDANDHVGGAPTAE
ncbi:hypothetical protein [Sanguibacter massiliensis]|uniref:hypothetical protein n=1 Tax=Sanguibacter massiliensis TaxID=1973217 RepID=UPI000C8632EB|nr:hypothetical protein [Sanguibacter massiliensis]